METRYVVVVVVVVVVVDHDHDDDDGLLKKHTFQKKKSR